MPFVKMNELTHPISALADRPTESAQALKAYFDGNAQSLMHALNTLISQLESAGAAALLGAEPANGMPGGTVQEQLKGLKTIIDGIISQGVPDGSLGMEKLNDELRQAIRRPYTYGAAEPSGGQDGDIYFRYSQ